ncbi:Protein preY, mitochondrial [Zea mays]|uniref:Protein preY, mitochondrial n=1 Tax=Zea mays TaxID=4577 RepID=A0A3L6EWK0_MAIZE|nr:Protein preY, mitochondrial [Zea mays]
MRRTAALLSTHGGRSIPWALADVLVCPLSKQPLRYCEVNGSLVSDAAGVAFPVLDGIPSLVPKDGKLLDDQEVKSEQEPSTRDSSG